MQYTKIFTLLTIAFFSGTGAFGCPAIEARTDDNKKFGSRIPLALDNSDGAMVSIPQTRNRFIFEESDQNILRQLHAEFRVRDIELLMLLPPPRPAYFPDELTARLFQSEEKSRPDDFLENYRTTVSRINELGVTSPDLSLLDVAKQDYYFLRDPHWTPRASSHAAHALAVDIAGLATKPLPALDTKYSTVGKLDKILSELCLTDPMKETSETFYPNGDGGLFGDRAASIAYAGTSFSISEGSRIPDQLEYLTGQAVQDFSVKGGGAEGAILSALQWLETEENSVGTLVWEVPYINSLSQDGFLRHVLGYLVRDLAQETSDEREVNVDGWTVVDTGATEGALLIEVHAPDPELSRIDFAVRNSEGVVRRKVARSRRLSEDQRIDRFFFVLLENEVADLRELKFAVVGKAGDMPMTYTISRLDDEELARRRQVQLGG